MHDPIGVILKHEGGYVNHPNDKGGPTNYGITQDTLSRWLGRPASIEDVKNLTKEEAREIYETRYLTGPRIHTLPDPPQTLVLDMAVNHGPRTAIKMVQRVVNMADVHGEGGPIDVDGIVGPQTRRAVKTTQEKMGNYFQNAIVEERIGFFKRIVARNPSQEVFLRGWLNRAESFRLPV
jgi:lysozyme family protein